MNEKECELHCILYSGGKKAMGVHVSSNMFCLLSQNLLNSIELIDSRTN